jgi:hypothetical protein
MKPKVVLLFIIVAVLMTAAVPLQEVTNQWRDIFTVILGLVVAALGAPITQALKNLLGWTEKAALVLSVVVALGVAVLELFLTGQLTGESFTIANLPQAFFLVYSVTAIYYGLLKTSEGFLGQGLLLKRSG